MSDRIFIYCDDPSHSGRRVAVTNFVRTTGTLAPGGGWTEVPATRAAAEGPIGTGSTLVGDTMPEPGWALDPEVSNRDIRTKLDLVCRKCKRRPVPARSENLFPVLDDWGALGVSELALAVLAASLQRKSEGNTVR